MSVLWNMSHTACWVWRSCCFSGISSQVLLVFVFELAEVKFRSFHSTRKHDFLSTQNNRNQNKQAVPKPICGFVVRDSELEVLFCLRPESSPWLKTSYLFFKELTLQLHNLFHSDLVQERPVPLGCTIWCCVFGHRARLDSNPGRSQLSPCPEPSQCVSAGLSAFTAFFRKLKVEPIRLFGWGWQRMLSHRFRPPTPQILLKISSGCSVERNNPQALCLYKVSWTHLDLWRVI